MLNELEAVAARDRRVFFMTMFSAVASAVLLRVFMPGLVRTKVTFPASEFFQPEAVAELAATFPASSEDEFILAAWDFVGRDISYEGVGSDIDFDCQMIECDGCYTVEQVLERGVANCVGKSALLGSILLNRLSPGRVFMAIGHYRMDGVGGHAWLEVVRDGQSYLIEATSPPKDAPWIPVASVESVYVPYAMISAHSLECLDDRVCLHVKGCNCGDRIRELSG